MPAGGNKGCSVSSSLAILAPLPGFVDLQLAAALFVAVQSFHGGLGFVFCRHLNETETARGSRVTVSDQSCRGYRTVLRKQLSESFFRSFEAEIPDVEILLQGIPPLLAHFEACVAEHTGNSRYRQGCSQYGDSGWHQKATRPDQPHQPIILPLDIPHRPYQPEGVAPILTSLSSDMAAAFSVVPVLDMIGAKSASRPSERTMKSLRLRKATAGDSEFAYSVKRAALREYVEQVWGWNEGEQLRLHEQRFRSQDFQVVSVAGTDVGIVALVAEADCLKVNQLLLVPEHQGRGIGRACMLLIMEEARALSVPVRLRVMKVNQRALRFYQQLGFEHTDETDTHHLLEWSL